MPVPDPRFFATHAPLSVGHACRAAGAEPLAASDREHPDIRFAGALRDAEVGSAAFADSGAALATAGSPTLLFLPASLLDAAATALPVAVLAVTDYPKAAFARLAAALHVSISDAMPPAAGIADDARIAATAQIAPSAVIAPRALIHEDVVIGPHVYIGPGVAIGAGTQIGSHASVTHAIIGENCRVSAGVRIGEAGFGYTPGEAGAVRVPQLGRVLIGDNVDLGANTTVDRGALSDTEIGTGTKIDNLCQIAHGCRIGTDVLIASLTGLSGSVTVGDGVMIGGQVGMAEHINIGAGAQITARAGLMKDVPPGERWGGAPAKPARQWMKETAALTRLAATKRDR